MFLLCSSTVALLLPCSKKPRFSKRTSRGSRIPSARRRNEKRVRCAAAGHSVMTSPEQGEGEGEWLSSLFVSPAAAPAYTSNLGHVQGRHNSSHHSSTQAKFRTRPHPLMQTMKKYIFVNMKLPSVDSEISFCKCPPPTPESAGTKHRRCVSYPTVVSRTEPQM